MGNESQDNFAKLEELLGYRPAAASPTQSALARAMEEIRKRREDEAAKEAEKLLLQALDLWKQKTAAEKQFHSTRAKLNKELGKIIAALTKAENTPDGAVADDEPEVADDVKVEPS